MRHVLTVTMLVVSGVFGPIGDTNDRGASQRTEARASMLEETVRATADPASRAGKVNCELCSNHGNCLGPSTHSFDGEVCSGGGNAENLALIVDRRPVSVLGSRTVSSKGERYRAEDEGGAGGCRNCKGFNSCHSGLPQAGSCHEFHYSCGSVPMEAAAAVALLPVHDSSSVAQLTAKFPRNIRVLMRRGLLVAVDCSGGIIGYSILNPRVLAEIRGTLGREAVLAE